MFQSAPIALALVAAVSILGTTPAEGAEQSVGQSWSVTLVKDTAVVRATKETEIRFIQTTIKALQSTGVKNFSLASQPTIPPNADSRSITIRLHDGEAKLVVSKDLPYEQVIAIISMLGQNKVKKIKFAKPTGKEDAAKQR